MPVTLRRAGEARDDPMFDGSRAPTSRGNVFVASFAGEKQLNRGDNDSRSADEVSETSRAG